MKKVGKTVIIDEFAKKAGITKKEAKRLYEVLGDIYDEAIKEGKPTRIFDLGTFYVKDVPPRKARNPRTGELVKVPAKKALKFKAAKAYKDIK